MERQGRGDVEDLVDAGLRCLRHAAPGVGGQGFEVTARPFRIQDSEREGRFPGTGDAGDSDDLPQRYVHIDVLEIVHLRPADKDTVNHRPCPCYGGPIGSVLKMDASGPCTAKMRPMSSMGQICRRIMTNPYLPFRDGGP